MRIARHWWRGGGGVEAERAPVVVLSAHEHPVVRSVPPSSGPIPQWRRGAWSARYIGAVAKSAVSVEASALPHLALRPPGEHDALYGVVPPPLLRLVLGLFPRVGTAWHCGQSPVVTERQTLSGVMALLGASDNDLMADEVPALCL